MIRLLISSDNVFDSNILTGLLATSELYSNVDSVGLDKNDEEIPPMLFKLLPYLKASYYTWVVTYPDLLSLQTFLRLMETGAWTSEKEIHFASDDALSYYSFPVFHKRVFVDKVYKE